ncbi:hypothetical protein CBL_10015 [Carabus blaptoides fortunei]
MALIDIYERIPCLYNVQSPDDHNGNKNRDAVEEMVQAVTKITMEVKKEIVEKYESGIRIWDLAAAYRMPRTTISTIVKNKDVIKSANALIWITKTVCRR